MLFEFQCYFGRKKKFSTWGHECSCCSFASMRVETRRLTILPEISITSSELLWSKLYYLMTTQHEQSFYFPHTLKHHPFNCFSKYFSLWKFKPPQSFFNKMFNPFGVHFIKSDATQRSVFNLCYATLLFELQTVTRSTDFISHVRRQ